MVPASDWLRAPASVERIRADAAQPRTFTPNRYGLHIREFTIAHGWVDLSRYFRLRSVLEPNLGGGYWNVPSADCYAGVSPSWYTNVWGDQNRALDAMMPRHTGVDPDRGQARIDDVMPTLLRTYGVTHLLSQFPVQGPGLTLLGGDADALIYKVNGTARARVVPNAIVVSDDRAAERQMTTPGFDPSSVVLLHDPAAGVVLRSELQPATRRGQALIRSESAKEVVVETESEDDGYLVLADTFYPGWTAQVDGTQVPITRANISVRAVQVPKGNHRIRFTYKDSGFERAFLVSCAAVAVLLFWSAGAAYAWRRALR
jgi:hypothetical protein